MARISAPLRRGLVPGDSDSRMWWEEILELAEEMAERWSPQSKLGEGARYIKRHYTKLTAYLNDPRLPATSNFSERMLRQEKLLQRSSMFRSTLEGRFALDVLRTVFQTAVAANAPLMPYLLEILRTPHNDVDTAPGEFTPRAWATKHPEQCRTVPRHYPTFPTIE